MPTARTDSGQARSTDEALVQSGTHLRAALTDLGCDLQCRASLVVSIESTSHRGGHQSLTGDTTDLRGPGGVSELSVHHSVGVRVGTAGAELRLATVRPLTPEVLQALAGLVQHLIDSELQRIRDADLLQAVLAEARRDPLTGLGNRRHWEQALQREASQACRTNQALAVLVLDLDGLKGTNDSHGHATGDALLRQTAEVLRQQGRVTDTACRLGGDEFGLLALVRDTHDATLLSRRLSSDLRSAGVQASIGTAVATGPLPPEQLDRLWREADEDMYRNKNNRSHET